MSKKLTKNTSPEALEAAFTHFNTVTDELIKAYQQLEFKVQELTLQLAHANDELLQKSQTNALLAQRLSALVNSLPAGVIETNSAGAVISCNQAAGSMLGGMTLGMPWPQAMLAQCTDLDGVTHLTDQESRIQRDLTIQACPLDDLSTIYLLFDVTTLRKLHEQLAQQQKLASMGQMAASLAHQLRTPLATALLYAKNLEKPELSAEDQIRFAQKIVGRLQALECLIREMLGFVKQDNHSEQTLLYPAALLIDEVEQSFAAQCEHQNVRLEIQNIAANLPLLRCRPKELVGAVINLLENALEHSKSDDTIILEVLLRQNTLELVVKDSGPGVPPELVSRIFEPFFTTRASGTGLGLAIAKRVIDSIGGELHYHRDNHHTHFNIILPTAGDP